MPTQMIHGKVRYTPARDMAHQWPVVVTHVAEQLQCRANKTLHKWLDSRGVTMDELGDGCEAYIRFLTAATDTARPSVMEAYKASGWLNTRFEVQVAYYFYLAHGMSGMSFLGIRDAVSLTPFPEGNLSAISVFMDGLLELNALTGCSGWLRWLAQRSIRVRNWVIKRYKKNHQLKQPIEGSMYSINVNGVPHGQRMGVSSGSGGETDDKAPLT